MSRVDLSLPAGVRAFAPDAAARLTGVSRLLSDLFDAHGFRRVVVPSIERSETVERGLGIEARARLFQAVEPGTGEVVAVCPDHTAQVARMWAGALHDLPAPVRVAYAGPVLRARGDHTGRPREAFQAGVEALGAKGALADAEMVALCAEALRAAGIADAVVDLGHAGFVTAFLEAAALEGEARSAAWEHLARKDAPSLEALLAGLPRGRAGVAKARAALPELATLYGQDTLDRARRLARRAGVGADAVAEVEAVLEAVGGLSLPVRVTVDLGELRGFGYYTGLTIHAYAEGAGTELATGGRYDDLLGRYGRPAPAVGLAVDLSALSAMPQAAGATPRGVLLVGGGRPASEVLAEAARLRETGVAVSLLPGAVSAEAASAHARAHGLGRVRLPARGARRTWRDVDV